ncbi:anthocyanin 3'-O-beta-glucosyltransferase-like [Canna indica]|uniref:Glycosyltransferase n=1 Tax=Canna indica TaxID=4628 RepID=A0AAQ3JME7_9LILI|nr:anthocyanin 3'-O-beta-glucosyltransferase-like [Canna indica]
MAAPASHTMKKPLRVFFIPFFASGHIIPMVDLACLFAVRPDVDPTLVLTPENAALVRPTLDRSAADGRPVGVVLFPFPSVGLPDGVENLATAPASESWRVYKAVDLAQHAHEEILRNHRPDAVVADIPYWWTTGIAAELGIPRVTFHAVGVFPQLVMNNLVRIRSEIQESPIVAVPGLPGRPIELPRAELPNFLLEKNHMTDAWNLMKEAQLGCHGVVVNTFYDLEKEYCDCYRKVDARRSWFVGPVALTTCTDVERGGGAASKEEGNMCLRWLDSREERSVVFVCFGSWSHFTEAQLREMATGLEKSARPFLWALRKSGDGSDSGEDNKWMPEGWEERVAEQGLVVRGWVPQVAILNHRAVGAFLSHCGWNSVLEAVAAGVPMLTWPLVFEQFINERLVVEVAGAGKRVWEGPRSEAEKEKKVVPEEAIAKAVSEFMAAGGEGETARKKARVLSAAARVAVEEGGSSQRDLDGLIEELLATRLGSAKQESAVVV